METKKIISKKKGFFELLLVTDGQGYMIDRYWERGGIFVLLLFILSVLPYSSKAQMSSDSLVQKISMLYIILGMYCRKKKSIYTLIIPVIIREILFGFNAMSSHPD